MGRGLLSLGSFLIVTTIALWIAGAAAWVSETFADAASSMTLRAALVLLAAALILRIVTPLAKRLTRGRCTVCGAAVARGHIYCLDHLQETVHSYRDRSR